LEVLAARDAEKVEQRSSRQDQWWAANTRARDPTAWLRGSGDDPGFGSRQENAEWLYKARRGRSASEGGRAEGTRRREREEESLVDVGVGVGVGVVATRLKRPP
jgi:hypothetical protein